MTDLSIALALLCLLLFINALCGLPKLFRTIYPPKGWKPSWPKLPVK